MTAKPICQFNDKMRIVDLSPVQRRKALQTAFVEYHRSWVRFDGPMVRHVRNNLIGKIDEQTIQIIYSEYSVGRFSLGGNDTEKKKNRVWIAKQFKKQEWKSCRTLKERSRICSILTAKIAKRLYKTRNDCYRPASFVTKVAWFLDPDDWTVFDSNAAVALGIPTSNAIERMNSYYCALDERGYVGVVKQLRSVVRDHSNVKLPPARILDLYLWYVGAECAARNKVDILTDAYVGGLPREWRRSIANVKKGLAKAAASPEFVRFNECATCGQSQ